MDIKRLLKAMGSAALMIVTAISIILIPTVLKFYYGDLEALISIALMLYCFLVVMNYKFK